MLAQGARGRLYLATNFDVSARLMSHLYVNLVVAFDSNGRIDPGFGNQGWVSVPTVAGRPFDFASGETTHTENSYKYRLEAFSDLATAAGWRPRAVWQDTDRLFSLHYLEVA